jgi:hypothetical protein
MYIHSTLVRLKSYNFRNTGASFMKQKLLVIGLLWVGFTFSTAHAQSITSASIGFSAGYISSDGGSLTISAGETVSGTLESETLSLFSGVQNTFAIVSTSIGIDNTLPLRIALYQNYPNPFNPSTNILFDLPQSSKVVLQVYNTIGSLVSRMDLGERSAGQHNVLFDASRLASGVYLYTLQVDGRLHSTKKMVLIK